MTKLLAKKKLVLFIILFSILIYRNTSNCKLNPISDITKKLILQFKASQLNTLKLSELLVQIKGLSLNLNFIDESVEIFNKDVRRLYINLFPIGTLDQFLEKIKFNTENPDEILAFKNSLEIMDISLSKEEISLLDSITSLTWQIFTDNIHWVIRTNRTTLIIFLEDNNFQFLFSKYVPDKSQDINTKNKENQNANLQKFQILKKQLKDIKKQYLELINKIEDLKLELYNR